MQCYDCAAQNLATPAVAVCSTCGAALCVSHTVLGHADEWTATVGNPSATRLPGRRLLCQTCSASGAEGEASAPPGAVTGAPGV